MGRQLDKELVIKNKKEAIQKINNTLEKLINSGSDKHLKKADVISFWLKEYSRYIQNEEDFNYKRVMHYKRGDVVQLNFGFNIGSEHGGLHYAIVLDNNNIQSSPVITVIPLSSGTKETTYERDIYLGNELYDKLKIKYDRCLEMLINDKKEHHLLTMMADQLETSNSRQESNNENNEELKLLLKSNATDIEQREKQLNRFTKEIERLKNGSVALMEQITTVSKMRIYKPKSSKDLLYNVKFSDGAMEKINERLIELFVHSDKYNG